MYRWTGFRWAGLLLLMTMLSGCTAMRIIAAHFQTTDHFIALPEENRIRFEPGAEMLARLVQPHLVAAIAEVEAAQHRAFKQPVVVYVCNSPESFSRMTGQPANGRGGVHPTKGLFLNPVLLGRQASIPNILVHELSHLHFNRQWRNNFVDWPAWFNEGFATLVSSGGGAEFVTEAEARKLVGEGKIFPPKQSGSRLALDQSGILATLGLPNPSHMFYRQSMMFVAYLKQRDEWRFKQFLLDIQDGEIFTTAFWRAFDNDVAPLQKQFTASLQ